MKAGEPWARPESAAIMARSSSEAADLILLTKDAKIRLIGTLRREGQTLFSENLFCADCQLSVVKQAKQDTPVREPDAPPLPSTYREEAY